MNRAIASGLLYSMCIVALATDVSGQVQMSTSRSQSSTSSAPSGSQSPSVTDTALLATVPTPPPGVVPHPGNMSGQPLQVGDLPPGTLSVRVIRGDFTRNVSGQRVDLRLESDGRTQTSLTGQDGRALFTGLAIGAPVQAATTLDGERLESQLFPVPSLGGVRLVLVGGATGTPIDVSPQTALAESPSESNSATTRPSTAMSSMATVGWVVGIWAIVGCAFFVYGRSKRRPGGSGSGPVPQLPEPLPERVETRERLVMSLVDAEREHKAGRLPADEYQRRRADIMDSLDGLYAASTAS